MYATVVSEKVLNAQFGMSKSTFLKYPTNFFFHVFLFGSISPIERSVYHDVVYTVTFDNKKT